MFWRVLFSLFWNQIIRVSAWLKFTWNILSNQSQYCSDIWKFFRTFFMPPKEFWEAYSNRTVRPSVPLRVRCISPIFFEVGIPNLVYGCILGWRSVAYHFQVTVTLTLTSDLAFLVITMSVPLCVRCISPIFFEVGIPNLMCGCILGLRSVTYHFQVTVTLTFDLVFRIIVSGAYLLYYWGRNFKFGVWMHLEMRKCCVL